MMFPDSLIQADKAISLFINNASSPAMDGFWLTFSAVKLWYPMYLIIAAAMVWRLGWKKGLAMVLTTALCILCIDQFANVVKAGAARLRPCNDPEMVAQGLRMLINPSPRSPYGFFSAHAANSIGFAICSASAFAMDRKKGKFNYAAIYTVVILIWALLVGTSRIFVGKHFFGDVLVGFIIGAAFALGLCKIAKALLDAGAAKSARTSA